VRNDDLDSAAEILNASEGKPSEARVYDYYLGGAANFEVDRAFAEAAIARFPEIGMIARENRRFLGRAVRFLLDEGIRQFVDIGSGIPTVGNVHQIAEQHAPGAASVVYVDHDPIAHAHAQILLDRDGDPTRHVSLRADLLDTEELWRQVLDTRLVDLSQPVALLTVAVLHFVTEDKDPGSAMAWLRAQLGSGSYLVLSHATAEGLPAPAREAAERVRTSYEEEATNPAVFRSREQITALFGDWPLVEPGLVWTPQWRPDAGSEFAGDATRAFILAGVGKHG
jgi:O-methyltransferase involved in polyketide biosynthesis